MLLTPRRLCRLLAAGGLLGALACPAALPPSLPPPATRDAIDDCRYESDHAAARAWRAGGSADPAEHLLLQGANLLRFRCRFEGSPGTRAYWDHDGSLDLSAARGLYFHAWSPDAAAVRQFNLYLRSGDGWYAAAWQLEARHGWQSIHIARDAMTPEGRPRGWAQIDGIRIAAWPGAAQDTDLYVANLCRAGLSAPIVLVQGEAAAGGNADEAAAAARACRNLARQLDDLGIDAYTVVSDRILSDAHLAGARLVALPHNPTLPEPAQTRIRGFVSRGGRLLGFYVLPAALEPVVGIRRGQYLPEPSRGHFSSIRSTGVLPGAPDCVRQSSWNIFQARAVPGRSRVAASWYTQAGRDTGEPAILLSDNMVHMTHLPLSHDDRETDLLLSMVAWAWPEAWERAARVRLQRAANYQGAAAFADATDTLAARGGAAAAPALARARTLHDQARAAVTERAFMRAALAADACLRELDAARAVALPARAREFRAVWAHRACGVPGSTWDESVATLARNGFTAVLPNIAWGGAAWYPSEYLPVAGDADRHDYLAECLRACRKYRMECHAWKICWNLKDRACRPFATRMAAAGRTQVTFAGQPDPQWLCPSHPDNQALEVAVIAEIANRYDVDGVHLDYIRYPDPDHCFCAGCRARFEAQLGRPIAVWPADVRRDEQLAARWLAFRRGCIDTVVRAAHDRLAQRARPCKLSAAVFTNANSDRTSLGQDWARWCTEPWLDFVCPMNYTPGTAIFRGMLRNQRAWTGRIPCYPGIGISTWPAAGRFETMADQILALRELGYPGFTLFEYDQHTMLNILPAAGQGLTRPAP